MPERQADNGQREASLRHNTNTSRRRLLHLIGAGGAAALAGCSGGSEEGTDPGTATETDTGTEAEKLQKSATVGVPWNVTKDFYQPWGITPYWARLFDPLTWPTQKLEAKPWLATDWKATGENTWEFELREDVTFHNGDSLNSERVIGGLENLFQKKSTVKDFANIKELSQPEDMKVKVTTKNPTPLLPELMTHPFLGIQHPDSSKDQQWGGVIGTGPFKEESLKPDQHIKLSSFENYWQNSPKTEELTIRFIEDNNTRALALAGGRIDVGLELSPGQYQTLNKSDKTNVETEQLPTTAACLINQHLGPTNDIKMRKALNYAVSQKKVIEGALSGVGGEPARGIVPPMITWSAHNSLPNYGPDKAKAKELVNQSAYAGETLTLLSTSPHPFANNTKLTAQVIQQQAKEVGVDIEIRTVELAAFAESQGNIPEADFHLWIDGSETVNAAALRFIRDYTSGSAEARAGTIKEETVQKMDSLFQKGLNAQDKNVRKEAWGEMQRILIEDVVIMVPLYYHNYIAGYNSKMKKFNWHPLKVLNRWEKLQIPK